MPWNADRQRCLDAGMNDHLAKPIVPVRLWDALQRWIASSAPSALAAPVPRAERGPLPDGLLPPPLPELDMTQGLRNALGRPAFYAELLHRFMESQGNAAERIAQALAHGHQEQAARDAHTLRGLAGTVGAIALQDAAGRLEEWLRSDTAPASGGVQSLIDGLRTALDALGAGRCRPGARNRLPQRGASASVMPVRPLLSRRVGHGRAQFAARTAGDAAAR
jgi:two-component system sensor histidine kinase/response regulator